MLDLDAYCARIDYTGSRVPNGETLHAIHTRHTASIPFENLDPLLGRSVPLTLDSLQAKLLNRRRGGYCFEQNGLFRAVLEHMGFTVTSLAARVLWMMKPEQPPNPRAHIVVRVDIDGDAYIADVGFGGYLLAAPLRLVANLEQPTSAGTMRLVLAEPFFTVQAKLATGWQDVYRFTLEPQFPIDVEVANWFTSTHPNSRFRNSLMVQRLMPEGRVSLLNRRFIRRHADGRSEEMVLTQPTELAKVLEEAFDLELPADPETLFARMPAA